MFYKSFSNTIEFAEGYQESFVTKFIEFIHNMCILIISLMLTTPKTASIIFLVSRQLQITLHESRKWYIFSSRLRKFIHLNPLLTISVV